jgi:methyltransferase (TIGR00027 family)
MDADRPAASAAGVALARALESALPPARRLFDDPFAPLFLGRFGCAVVRLCRNRGLRRLLLGALERLTPGARGISVGRTRFIDDAASAALGRGAEQVVILGAGYDTRALRIGAIGGIPTFEVDHPATQRRKRATLAGVLPAWPPHLHLVPVDFERDDLGKALREAGFRESRPGLVVWEGVTEYLDAAAVAAVLRWCAGAMAPGSELVFTYADRALIDGTRDFPGGRRLLAMNRAGGEPYRFGFAPDALADDLAAYGLELLEDAAGREFAERYFCALGRRLRGNEYERTARVRIAPRTTTPARR